MNFRNKSIIWVGSIIVVAFAITAYFIGEKMTQSTRKMSVDLALAKANNSLLIVETEIEKSCRQAELFTDAVEEFAYGQEISLIKEILESDLIESSEISARWFIRVDGKDKLSGIVLEKSADSILVKSTSPIHEKILWDKLKNLKGTVLTQPYKNDHGKELISILTPVIVNSYIHGIIGFDIDLRKFQQVFYDNKSLRRAYVSIISKDGICITHPDENLIGKQVANYQDSSVMHLALRSGEKQQKEVISEYLNLPVMRVYKPIRIANGDDFWLITVSVPLFNVKESVIEMRNLVFLIGLVLALLLMVFLYFSQRRWLYESTKRRRAEKRHLNEVSKLSSIMESTDQIMIFSVGHDYKYTSFNTVHKEEILKFENETIKEGKSILDAYHEDFRIKMKMYLDRALGGEHFLVEYQRHGIDYQQIFNAISDADGKVVGVASFKVDISETLQLRKKAQEEEEEKVKAQLKNIKNQINPHFLFNSLNSLYALVDGEPKLARKFIVNLSKVYRYLLDSNNSNLIQLQQEMDFIKQYVFLQKIRFGENLILEYDIPEEAMQCKLPSVSIQSLVENAIKHNVITSDKPLRIRIKVTDDNCLVVDNPYQPRTDLNHSPGTGLKNLDALYSFLGDRKPYYGIEKEHFIAILPLF